MASKREQQQEETHFRVMRLLEEDPSISTREIARRVGISNGGAYYCVTALVDKGFVKLKNFARSKQRVTTFMSSRRAVFVLRQCSRFLFSSARHEYENLKLEIDRLESELGVDETTKPGNTEGPV